MKIYLTVDDNKYAIERYVRFHKKKHPRAFITNAQDFLFIIKTAKKDYVFSKRESLLNLKRMSRFD